MKLTKAQRQWLECLRSYSDDPNHGMVGPGWSAVRTDRVCRREGWVRPDHICGHMSVITDAGRRALEQPE